MEGKFCCADCYVKACRTRSEEKYPDFCPTKNLDPEVLEEVLQEYGDEETRKLTVTSACLESEFYCKLTRVEETVLLIERMGYRKVGVATCVGLLDEARTFTKILRAHGLDVYTVCCKCGAVDKTAVVPEQYMRWLPNYEYTYIFKITDEGGVEIDMVIASFTDWNEISTNYAVHNW